MENESMETNDSSTIETEGATIETQETTTEAAATAEETVAAYQALFEKQRAEKQKADEQIKSLQNQIAILMRNGGSVTAPSAEQQPEQSFEPEAEREPYVSLSELGREIGKRDYSSHNANRE